MQATSCFPATAGVPGYSDGGSILAFVLGAPPNPGQARLRITYYFRGA